MNDRSRLNIFHNLIIVMFAVILLRLAFLQLVQYSFFNERSYDQHTSEITLTADRGDIYDRNGDLLATSIDTGSVYVRPKAIKENKAMVESELIRLFPDKAKLIKEKFASGSQFWLKRKIDKGLAMKVRELKCTAIDIWPEKKRIYPKGRLASHLIGFAAMDNIGREGIECGFDSYLKGTEGKYIIEKDVKGRQIATGSLREIQAPTEGMNVYLTIDSSIQYVAERELKKAVDQYKPESASVMVMDVKTGEILAVASWPDYDPNDRSKVKSSVFRLIPIVDIYEPGSTFKLITAAAGLDEGLVQTDTVIPCPNTLMIGKKPITNSHTVKYFEKPFKTLTDVIAESINTGTAHVGLLLGQQRFLNHIKAFGFGEKTGIEYPGEGKGIVAKDASRWSVGDMARSTYGQSIAVTQLQMLCAINSIANGGVRVKPRLIKKIESVDQDIVRSTYTEKLNKVISGETVNKMTEIMKGVVTMPHGTGHKAKMAQYTCAVKTGTAQKASRGVYLGNNNYIASIIGFAPADNPRISMIVMLNHPIGSIWGAVVAAPVFKNTGEFALRYLNEKPDM